MYPDINRVYEYQRFNDSGCGKTDGSGECPLRMFLLSDDCQLDLAKPGDSIFVLDPAMPEQPDQQPLFLILRPVRVSSFDSGGYKLVGSLQCLFFQRPRPTGTTNDLMSQLSLSRIRSRCFYDEFLAASRYTDEPWLDEEGMVTQGPDPDYRLLPGIQSRAGALMVMHALLDEDRQQGIDRQTKKGGTKNAFPDPDSFLERYRAETYSLLNASIAFSGSGGGPGGGISGARVRRIFLGLVCESRREEIARRKVPGTIPVLEGKDGRAAVSGMAPIRE